MPLTCSQALVKAILDSSYKSIADATRLLVFFATPHRGGNFAGVGELVATLARAFLRTPRNDFLDALKKGSEAATAAFERSRYLHERYLFVSFFEGLPYGNVGIVRAPHPCRVAFC